MSAAIRYLVEIAFALAVGIYIGYTEQWQLLFVVFAGGCFAVARYHWSRRGADE